jgi:hypothetical protein
LKDVGETYYPGDRFGQALRGCHFAVMTNAAFSRPVVYPLGALGALFRQRPARLALR